MHGTTKWGYNGNPIRVEESRPRSSSRSQENDGSEKKKKREKIQGESIKKEKFMPRETRFLSWIDILRPGSKSIMFLL